MLSKKSGNFFGTCSSWTEPGRRLPDQFFSARLKRFTGVKE